MKPLKEGLLLATFTGAFLGLHLYDGTKYNKLVTSYANDFLGSALLYSCSDILNIFNKSKLKLATLTFLSCSALEIAQALKLYPGTFNTFDPNDFIAYASGIGLALGINKLILGKKQRTLENNLIDKF